MAKNWLFRSTAPALGTIFVLLLFPAGSLAQPGRAGTGPWDWHPMWGWGMWGMGIMMMIFWAAIIVGIVALVRWLWTQGKGVAPTGDGKESPLDIAKRRYASGEITKGEFESLKRDLS